MKLKLQYFYHLMWRADSMRESDAGKDWGQEVKRLTEGEMVGRHRQLRGVILGKLQEMVEDRGACHTAVHAVGHDSATEQQTTMFVR